MTRRENRCHALALLVLGFLALEVRARSWDLAVVVGSDIHFYARNGTLTGQVQIKDAVDLRGVTYDDVTRTMFLSDVKSNSSIFSNDLTEKNFTSRPLLKKEPKSQVISMVFNAVTSSLFWVDGQREVIMKMQVAPDGSPQEPVVLHDLKGKIPRSIALDMCNSHVYWVNSNSTNPSVERSNLDGSNRVVIIKEYMYEPLALAIDHIEEKLYWIDDVEGIHFRIERSNLDGSQRELMLHNRHQEPLYLAVDRDWIYWSDRTFRVVWRMPKIPSSNASAEIFKNDFQSTPDYDPAGIVARDNVGKLDCDALARMRKRAKLLNAAAVPGGLENYNNLTTSTEESDSITESSTYCLNDGEMNNRDGSCHCRLGFSGERCETSLCHNYCLRGNCKINDRGLPKCECGTTFTGTRCEKDVCDGYCLHDGKCSIENGKPTCKCKYWKGTRCEELDDIVTICAMLCANSQQYPSSPNENPCRCSETNETAGNIMTISEGADYGPILSLFSAVIAALIILIVILSYYVNKLRRRPRIKKRFVVSKGGVTPLTSRPQIPDNQCEITIENCCNMNICETPCFEPKLRTAVPRSNNTKKEEKNSLLDNMEGNSC